MQYHQGAGSSFKCRTLPCLHFVFVQPKFFTFGPWYSVSVTRRANTRCWEITEDFTCLQHVVFCDFQLHTCQLDPRRTRSQWVRRVRRGRRLSLKAPVLPFLCQYFHSFRCRKSPADAFVHRRPFHFLILLALKRVLFIKLQHAAMINSEVRCIMGPVWLIDAVFQGGVESGASCLADRRPPGVTKKQNPFLIYLFSCDLVLV